MDAHLDSSQIDRLLRVSAETESEWGAKQSQDENVRIHLTACEICQARLRAEKNAMDRLAQLKPDGTASPGPLCPPCEVWIEVVAGINRDAENYLSHAAQCDQCGPLLREASEVLADETTAEEEQFLAASDSGRVKNRYRALALELADRSVADRQPRRHWQYFFAPSPLALATGGLALIATAWLAILSLRQPSTPVLLAQAYSEHRTLEARIPGAKFAPMRVERGGAGSDLEKPASLLKAEALISEKLAKSPNDPVWLDDKARADLLSGNYDSAISSLERALQVQPDSSQLLTDLGTAYFSRAKSTERAIDYGHAYESLSKALTKSPDDPVALFNRALTCEQLFLYTQAREDWEHYLRIDSQGDWAQEARQHLNDVSRKLTDGARRFAEPLMTPKELMVGGDRDFLDDKLDARIEEYVKVAITKWLPAISLGSNVEQAQAAEFALGELAGVARTRHADYWLEELLRDAGSSTFKTAVSALADSVQADEHGDYSSGRSAAHLAAKLFGQASSQAGGLRAQAEEVYADHLLWEGDRCLSLLREIYPPLRQTHYTWIQTQMNLETSNCAELVGDMKTYHDAVIEGTREAEVHHYKGLFLRGLGFQSLEVGSLGNANLAFSLAFEGLALFWSGRDDLMMGYNLYTDLDSVADEVNLPYLQVDIWREATALIDRHPDVLLRAMAHRWYGNAAYLVGLSDLASSEFGKASALFAASPATPATVRDRVDAEIWLAQIEIRRGNVVAAASRLKAEEPILATIPGFNPEVGFYTTQADIAMRQGEYAAAEPSLRSSLFLAEWALNTFSDDSDRHQWAEEAGGAYRNVVEWKRRIGDPDGALELWEWYRGAEFRAETGKARRSIGLNATNPPDPSRAPPIPRPTTVSEQLYQLRNETTIAFGSFQDGIAIWVYDDRGIYSRWIPTPLAPVQERVAQLHRLCSDPESDLGMLRATARSLYDLLIAPIDDHLKPGRAILLEPDDALAEIPWEALIDHSSRYFGEVVPIAVTPGLYQRMHLRNTIAITTKTPALVVSVPAVPGLLGLPNVEDEAQAVTDRFSSVKWLQSDDATLSAIRRELPGKLVFHFAGHAVATPAHSGLALAELDPNTQQPRFITGQSLQAVEFAQLQLAVLSACNSGSESKSPATLGLIQALLKAGVPHVVASRWKVDSRETENFMKLFYAHLLAGQDTASSMQAAETAQASKPSTAHPYYWAAFGLQGVN